MDSLFVTHFPSWLLVIVLVVIAAAVLLVLLKWVFAVLIIIVLSVKYLLQGRIKEFHHRMLDDTDFLTFDKETGKFIW